MPKKKKINKEVERLRRFRKVSIGIITGFFLLTLFFLVYNLLFSGRIYPNTYVAGNLVSGKSPGVASELLSQQLPQLSQVTLVLNEEKFSIDLKELDFAYDYDESAKSAFLLLRTGNLPLDFYKRFLALFEKTDLGARIKLSEEKLNEALAIIDSKISTPPVYPSVKLSKGTVEVEKGSSGSELDKDKAIADIFSALSSTRNTEITLSLKTVDPSISEAEAEILSQRAEKVKTKSLSFGFEYQNITLSGQELLNLLDPKSGYNKEKTEEFVSKIASLVNRPPQDPTFIFEENRVKEFAPSREGVIVREETLEEMITGNLTTLEATEEEKIVLSIPVDSTPSSLKTEDVNNLGIKELIGRGDSRFAHSIPNRIYNVGLASSRFKGVLIKPGDVFSFNDVLGDVSALTGYKQAFVIKDGKTVLGDGGGVCQVSSTLFRAVLAAGLPIVERRAHSYRVGYYEQNSPPGLDATVFAPTTDFKFKNDTPGHLLIQPIFDGSAQTLVFEIYGTDDGRVATTTTPKVSGITAAPPDMYVDDPTLPSGVVRQIDFKAAGARVSFDYKVTKEGQEIYSNTFVSNYRPWQAVYLRGTGPVQ